MKLCIYHKNCLDGFAAAYAVWKKFGKSCRFHAADYHERPPEVIDTEILLVDFSYSAPVIEHWLGRNNTVTVLDHHKTAIEALTPLFNANRIQGDLDLNRSGCVIAWEYFHPLKPMPEVFYAIQDRDLWRWERDDTEWVTGGLQTVEHDFDVYDALLSRKDAPLILSQRGKLIHRIDQPRILHLCEQSRHELLAVGAKNYFVPVVNCPPYYASKVGEKLAREKDFAVMYWDLSQQRRYSLRSSPAGVDVAEIAKQMGGGGHKHAAGFTGDKESLWWDGF